MKPYWSIADITSCIDSPGRPSFDVSASRKGQKGTKPCTRPLYKGRVHGFVPFCPFREALTSKDGRPGESMQLVMSAIDQYGFIGVKLYPPMGFAAWNNVGVEAKGTWKN